MNVTDVRGAASVVGVGLAGIGIAPGFTHLDLIGLAVRRALDDAGLNLADIDGLFACNMVNPFPTLVVGEYLGIQPRTAYAGNTGGNAPIDHVHRAAASLAAGECDVALVCYGSNQRSAKVSVMPADVPIYEALYKPREPIASYALAATRHMHQYGTTRQQMAEVAVAARQWAKLNPVAFAREQLTIDDVLASRMICDPIGLLDCCLVTDGAGAVLMTRPDRARDCRTPAVHLLGCATWQTHRQISQMPDLTITAASVSGPAAFRMAKVEPKEVSIAQLYDAFTINPILFLEDLGFCAKGEGGAFVADGGIAPGGRLPVNTNGGGLSCVHPGMNGIFEVIEAVEQLRGTAGERQVADAAIVLCHGNGGLLSCQTTAIFGTDAALT